ncbi:DUF2487 family protein [Virgibacillus kekensis]|uniref:DUF2487 family protein n=1 Tax=Virgibacillus kekensis TaxID=202261 RepID=A0ABV9DF44_9BACI
MKWIEKDLEQYIKAKEYVDTVIVPLLPFQLSTDTAMGKDAVQREALVVFLQELEKELTGRVMVTPEYNYLKSAAKEQEIERMHTWIRELQSQPFHHIFYITNDSSWKKKEQSIEGTLLWMPGSTKGSVKSKEMQAVIQGQVEQVSELIKSYWQESEEV